MWNDTNEWSKIDHISTYIFRTLTLTSTPHCSNLARNLEPIKPTRMNMLPGPQFAFHPSSIVVYIFLLYSCLFQSYYERWCFDWPVPLDMLNTFAMLHGALCISLFGSCFGLLCLLPWVFILGLVWLDRRIYSAPQIYIPFSDIGFIYSDDR